jgi:hypothetical protein
MPNLVFRNKKITKILYRINAKNKQNFGLVTQQNRIETFFTDHCEIKSKQKYFVLLAKQKGSEISLRIILKQKINKILLPQNKKTGEILFRTFH